jgi:NTE family protein
MALSPPASVQVVFQGGGAKLCLLMAVADVLQQYQAERKILIRRVAGSSAGAIAAVMLASGQPISAYKESVKRLGRSYLDNTKINSVIGKARVAMGTAYFKELHLENFFEELFITSSKSPKIVGDLTIQDTKIYFTDLYSLSSRVVPNDEPIAKALAKSCRFPFAFVGYNSGDTHVDGGLAHNLPVDDLKADESSLGPVIGISFSNGFGDQKKSNIVSYTQQLFSAAIRFDTWLATWLKTSGPIEPLKSSSGRKLLRPSLTDSAWPMAIVREIDERVNKEPSTKARIVACYETAIFDEKGAFANKYVTRTVKTFSVIRDTNILQFDFEIGREGSFAKTNLGGAGFDSNGNRLAFTPHVEELTKADGILRSFRVYFCLRIH